MIYSTKSLKMKTKEINIKSIKVVLLMMMSVILLTNCKRDKLETVDEGDTTPDIPISNFFAKYQPPTENFTINEDQGATIIGTKGTVIRFNPNIFVDQSNNPVTGNIDIQLTELYSKGDLLLSKRPTVSGSEMLVSGGAINLVVTQNGQKLTNNTWGGVNITMPGNGNPIWGMEIFNGVSDVFTNQDQNVDSTFDWTVDPDSSWVGVDSISWQQDSMNVTFSDFSYFFSCNALDWINCDYYWGVDPKTTVSVHVPKEFENHNTNVFIVFKNIRSVLELYCWLSGDPYHDYNSARMPIGSEIQVIVISGKDDEYYASVSDHTVALDDVYVPTLTPITEIDLKALIDAL